MGFSGWTIPNSAKCSNNSEQGSQEQVNRIVFRVASTLLWFIVAPSVIVSLAAQSAQVAPKQSFVLERGRAGQFEIGMTVDELYKVAGREQVRSVTSHRGAESRPAWTFEFSGFTGGPALRISLDPVCTGG
jgi:hypothetical protein